MPQLVDAGTTPETSGGSRLLNASAICTTEVDLSVPELVCSRDGHETNHELVQLMVCFMGGSENCSIMVKNGTPNFSVHFSI